jgi:flagellar hook-length control protein FliK
LLHRVARALNAAQQREGEIQLRLSPPELGALRLQVQVVEGALTARLEAETTAARTALIDNLPALRDRLAEQGVRIERFDVDLMQRQPGGTPDRPQDHDRDLPPQPRASGSRPTAPPPTSRPQQPRIAGSGQLNVII